MYKSPALTFHQLFDSCVVGGLSKFVCVLACNKYMLYGNQKSLSLTKKKKRKQKNNISTMGKRIISASWSFCGKPFNRVTVCKLCMTSVVKAMLCSVSHHYWNVASACRQLQGCCAEKFDAEGCTRTREVYSHPKRLLPPGKQPVVQTQTLRPSPLQHLRESHLQGFSSKEKSCRLCPSLQQDK